MNDVRTFVVWFAQEHNDFKQAELEAIASLENVSLKLLDANAENPYFVVECSEDGIRKIAARCIMIKFVVEIWAIAANYFDLYERLTNCDNRKLPQYCSKDKSYKINVETFGKKVAFNEQIKQIEKLEFLGFEGRFDLRNADNIFYLIEFYGLDANNIPPEPFQVFFGRWISDGQRNMIKDITLKKRKFISNTSMDPMMSLLMTNIAKVKHLDFVLDPFVGSGSILVPAAKFGAFVMGTDIDFMLMYGRSKPTRCGVHVRQADETIYSNLKQYNLESKYVDVIVADSSLPLWRPNFKFDAIITDPPYGIREASAKIGSEREYKIPPHLCEGHVPSKVKYNFSDIIRDLLNYSAIHLRLKGRLVFWVPYPKGAVVKYHGSQLSHPCFKLISKCEQILSKSSSRFLICMEKIKEPNNILEEE